jgi:hypothetical protein
VELRTRNEELYRFEKMLEGDDVSDNPSPILSENES